MKKSQTRKLSPVSVVALAAGMLGAAFVMSAPASAQGTPEQQQACQSDAYRLCSEFIPDAQKTGACMARKRSQLSPACKSQFHGGGTTTHHTTHKRHH
jgi:hypothetical protein